MRRGESVDSRFFATFKVVGEVFQLSVNRFKADENGVIVIFFAVDEIQKFVGRQKARIRLFQQRVAAFIQRGVIYFGNFAAFGVQFGFRYQVLNVKVFEIAKVRVERFVRHGLVGAVAESRLTDRQHLPYVVIALCQKIYKIITFSAESACAVIAG